MMRQSSRRKALVYVLLIMVVACFLLPIFWTLLLSIRPASTNLGWPPALIFGPTADHLGYCFVSPGVSTRYLWNSFVISFLATLLSMPFAIPAAYAFARYTFKGKRGLLFWFLGLYMGPPLVFLLPYVILMSKLQLVGTYLSMIIVFQSFTIPFSILVMKSFIQDIPVELEESAMVDGASRLYAAFKIIMPLALPGIIVSAMFAFVFSWNNAAFPLVLSKQMTKPLPIGTLNFFATTGINWNWIAATSVVTMLPPMLLFLSLEKYLVRGLTFGAVKG